MSVKALDLFQAFNDNALPTTGGYIVSSFFDVHSKYARYEIVSYSGVKNIFQSEDGLTFQSDGKKIYILAEPPTYPKKFIEPYVRDKAELIPHRFSELHIQVAHNQTKVMFSKEPVNSYSSFTILRPTSINFALVFFPAPDLAQTMTLFFSKTLNREAGVPQADAEKIAAAITGCLAKLAFTF